jgi:hypothetical protein
MYNIDDVMESPRSRRYLLLVFVSESFRESLGELIVELIRNDRNLISDYNKIKSPFSTFILVTL